MYTAARALYSRVYVTGLLATTSYEMRDTRYIRIRRLNKPELF